MLLKFLTFLILILTATPGIPFSVQTHETIIDLAWKHSISPVLLKRFPNLTEAQLQQARAYAYGGSAIQDFGYYPFGNAFFSDLTHYIRSGDFVRSLLRNSQNANDLAFAIGSLSHYIGDNIGHGEAVNHSVPIEFPRLEQKYGSVVNYSQSPHAHVQTEFAFDINQLSKGRFAPSSYLEYVGLNVPMPLLRTAFYETYGLSLPDIIGSKETSIRIYRHAVRSFLPNIARAQTILHKNNFPQDSSSEDFIQLRDELLQVATEDDWQQYRKHPGFGSHLYAGFIYIVPKVGVLKMLSIKGPTEQTEDLYIRSVNHSLRTLRYVMANYDRMDHYISNRDLDTGVVVKPGGYPLTDRTYAELLAKLTSHPTYPIPIQLKHDIEEFYSDPLAPITTKNNPKQWAQVQANLKVFETMSVLGQMEPIPDEILGAN
ncbi:MAG TPA: zinc dependent phospholipase C family protein [Edaphobacter sp.]|nr:zinc dependent phospholipase C family protein [Edaphobacter sp.]